MGTKRIDIRKPAQIGISNIDVSGTNKKLLVNTIPKNALKVKLRIGVFFDGTGNNGFNSDAVYYKQDRPFKNPNKLKVRHNGFDVPIDSSYFNPYSNVQLLHDIYETTPQAIDNLKVKNDPHFYLQLKVYIEGIGTLKNEEDDALGTAFGEGNRGVVGRAEQACTDITIKILDEFDKIKSKNKNPLYIDSIQFDVFGFSRGAAAARHFCNEVLQQINVFSSLKSKEEKLPVKNSKLKRDAYLIVADNTAVKMPDINNLKILSGKEFTGGKLGKALNEKQLNYPKKNVTVEFLGLFETVISQMLEKEGVIDFAKNNSLLPTLLNINPVLKLVGAIGLKKVGQIPKVNPDVSHPNIKKVFHIVASNEWRENFALTPISNYSYGSTLRVLGAHSDIGGGYANEESEINILHFFDAPADLTESEVNKANNFKLELRQWYINNLFCPEDLENIFWETMHHVKIYDIILNDPLIGPEYNPRLYYIALINDTILGNETEKVVDYKLYKLVNYHYILKSKRKLNNKLSLVYLNVMKHMATKFANVPLTLSSTNLPRKAEYQFDENFDLSKIYNTKISYQDLIIRVAEHGWAFNGEKPIEHKELFTNENGTLTYKVPLNLYYDLKLRFVHLSAHFNSPAKYFESLSEYEFVYPHAPNFTFEEDFKNPPYERESYPVKINQ
jgi:hypothetical protein